MTLQKRILATMLTIIFVTGVFNAFILISINQSTNTFAEHQYISTPKMILAMDLQKDIIQIQQWLTDVSATKAEPGFDDGFDEAETYYNHSLVSIDELKTLGVSKEFLDILTQDLNDFYFMGIEMPNTYINEGTSAGNAMMEEFDPFAEAIQLHIEDLNNEVTMSFDASSNKIESGMKKVQILAYTMLVTMLIIAIAAVIVLQLTIVRPLKKITEELTDMVDGKIDIKKPISIQSKDEIGQMATAINTFSDAVRGVITNLNLVGENINLSTESIVKESELAFNNAEMISRTITDVAKGASEQAELTMTGSYKLTELGESIASNQSHSDILLETTTDEEKVVKRGLEIIEALSLATTDSIEATNEVSQNFMESQKSAEKIRRGYK